MASRSYDDILNDFARRSLGLGSDAYVRDRHRVLDDRCKKCVTVLASSGKSFPPNIAFDLFAADKVGAAGPRFKEIPHHDLWDAWLRSHWIPVVQGRDSLHIEFLLGMMVRPLESGQGGRASDTPLDRLRKLDAAPESCWMYPTGQAILDVVKRGAPLRELVTQSALIEAKARRPRSDALYGASLLGGQREVEDRSNVGTAAGGNRSEVIESFAGKFLSRHPGSLPENIGRLSPVELLYLRRSKRLFLLRVAESALDQRFFEMHLHSNRVMSIRVRLALAEDERMYRSPDGGRADRHRYRSLYIDLLMALIVAGQDVNVDLAIVVSHETMFDENDRLDVAIGADDLVAWKSFDSHRLALELSGRMPNLLSEWPRPNDSTPIDAATNERQSYDKEIDLILASPGRSVRQFSSESEVYRVSATEDGLWRIRNADPMHAAGLVDWVMHDVFAAGDGAGQRARQLREVEFAS